MINTTIPLYGIMINLSILSNFVVILLIYDKNKFSKTDILIAFIYEIIGILVGAKILNIIENYITSGNIINFLNAGLSSYGSIIGALINLFIFSKIFNKKYLNILILFSIPIPLMYAIGKIGCFFSGCCYGIEYYGIGNVIYNYSNIAPNGLKLFPIQIVETLVFLSIFIYMLKNYTKRNFEIKQLLISIIICAISKFLLDYFRMSHKDNIISLNQIISLIFIVIGCLGIIFIKKHNNVK